MTPETQIKSDMEFLNSRPEFRRFMWRAIQMAGFFEHRGPGKSERDLAYAEGRRSLGLELLDDAEQGQPAAHPDRIPILTTIQILREEAQQATSEGRKDRHRYDRTADISPDVDSAE